MADVTIDGSISTSSARGLRSVVFTTQAIGYWFYIDSGGTFVYSKTSDGGATWGAAVTINSATTQIAFDVWYDQWTPLDAGTLIHTWYFDVTNDKVFWRSLNTNGDTLGTERTCFTGASAVAGNNAYVSGTKTRSGYLYVCSAIDASNEQYFGRSTDSGTTWSAALSATFQEANPDHALLFPATGTGDDNDCWAIYHDSSATALTMKMWDSSAVAQVESSTVQTIIAVGTDLTTYQYPYSGSIRKSDGHLILVSCSDRDTATSDMQCWDVSGVTAGSLSGITAKTDITTNIDDNYNPAVFLDPLNDDIYVAYNGKRDGSETLGTTTKVYYTKSTNGGTSWSAGDTAYQEGATSADIQVWAPLTGRRFYVGWRVGTTLIGNKVSSVVPSSAVLPGAILSFVGATTKRVGKALSGALSFVGALTTNTSPAIALNTTDGSTLTGTPTLEFTGTDPNADDVRYNIKIDDHASFLTTVDSYSETNQDNNVIFSATRTGAAQAFTGDGSKIASAKFYLAKNASPTGNAFAKLYALTLTFGTDAKPTGAALATSDALDVTTVGTSSALFTLAFSGANQVRMTNATKYCIALEYSGSDATNRIAVGEDSSSPTHAGNQSVLNSGVWSGGSGNDLCFYVLPVAPLLDKVSGTDAGFANTVSGGDTDPFNSGEKASFTVQAGDTLAAGTYYWIVRAKDPSGTNAYSAFATARSFIVGAATVFESTLTASLSSSGSITKRDSKLLSGAALSFVGAITKRTAHLLSGTLSASGTTTKSCARALTGALSFIGTILKSSRRTFTGILRLGAGEQVFDDTNLDNPTNTSYSIDAADVQCGIGQSFISRGGKILSATFNVYRVGTISGSAYAKLYTVTGTHGVDAKPGTLLATSFPYNVTDFTTDTDFNIGYSPQFVAAEQYQMTSGTPYCIEFFWNNGGNGSNKIVISANRVAPFIHDGNTFAETTPGNWTALSNSDVVFVVTIQETGGLTLLPNKLFSAALSFSGVVRRSIAHILSSALSFVGSLTKRIVRSALTGALSFVGAITRTRSQLLTATLYFVGSLSKTPSKLLAGTLSFAGSLLRQIGRLLSGTLSFTGTLTRQLSHLLSGILSFTGTLTKRTSRTLTGTLSFIGSCLKSFAKTFTASLSSSGNLRARGQKLLAASLTFAGAVTKRISHMLSAALTFVGNFVKTGANEITLVATLAFSGSTTRSITHALSGTLSFLGNCLKTLPRTLSATLSFVGITSRSVSRQLSGSLSFVGSLVKRTSRTLSAALSFLGSLLKRTSRTFSTILSFLGNLATSFIAGANYFFQTLTGTLSFTGALANQPRKSLTAVLSFAGSIRKSVARTLPAILSSVGAITKRAKVSFAGALSFIGAMTSAHRFVQMFIGALSFTTDLQRTIAKTLQGALGLSGSLIKAIATNIAGTLSFVGLAIVHLVVHYFMEFTASISFSTSLLRRLGRIIPIVIDAIARFAKIVVGLFVAQEISIEVPATVIHEVSIDVPPDSRIVRIVVPGTTSSVSVQA